jgi:tRNA A37 threonylcarbamoyladenosine dehydratase
MNQETDNDYENRFSAMGRLYGIEKFSRFKDAHITIVGLGGVGSWTAESLCRSGIGKLTLIDLDEVCVSNTNRQLHALSHTIGKSKVSVLKERLQQINPEIEVNAIEDFLTQETIEDLLTPKMNVVVDAIDSLKNKAIMANFCKQREIPLVTLGGAGGKTDPTKIRIGDLSESTQDSLLKRLKKKLRRDFNFEKTGPMKIMAVYSIERAVFPDESGSICFKKDLTDKTQAKLDCATGMGTASFTTGSFGFAAAKAAIDII